MDKLVRKRGVIKSQYTSLSKHMEEGNVSYEDLFYFSDKLRELAGKFENVQSDIETLADEETLREHLNYREEIETVQRKLSVNLKIKISNLKPAGDESIKSNVKISGLKFETFNEEMESISNFSQRFENFIELYNITEAKSKSLVFLNSLPPYIYSKLRELVFPRQPNSLEYAELKKILEDYLDPKTSTWAQQCKFMNCTQKDDETINIFNANLKCISSKCNFNCKCGNSIADLFLRLQFIRGLKDADLRAKLIQFEELSYPELIEKARLLESSRTESRIVDRNNIGNSLNKLDKVKGFNSGRENQKGKDFFKCLKGKCYRCTSEDHRANVCKFREEICNYCGKRGHIRRACLQRRQRKRKEQITNWCETRSGSRSSSWSGSQGDLAQEQVNTISDVNKICSENKIMIELQVDGKQCAMELDTGAALSSLSVKDFERICPNRKLHPTSITLRTYTGELVKPQGVAWVKVNFKSKTFKGKLLVLSQDVTPICGRDWIKEIKLDWADIGVLSSTTPSCEHLLREYKGMFQDRIGEVPGMKCSLKLKEGAIPVYCKPRPVPYAIKSKVEDELKRLQSMGIIQQVDRSEWGTPIVPVKKSDGSIRICADYKITLNKNIADENYPIPRIEDIMTELNGGRYFCTLDIHKAYLNLEMDEESALMQTLSTHIGLFKVKRLMFGVKAAPSIWQRFMDKTLQGLEGVTCFFDDILVQGSTYKQTLERLKAVLRELQKNNLYLNKEKCKFFQPSVEYLGVRIDKHGVYKTKDKTKAISESTRPSNVDTLRTFLGMVNYYNKFIPNLATKLRPLYELLKKKRQFNWTQDCQVAYENVKKEIVSDTVLTHYNPDLPLVLATDASPHGLGAVLAHRLTDGSERPIAFASRSLTKCERKYSQIDREATAIFWGLKKFYTYCYGRKFILKTDHKPLTSIFHPHKALPNITATRIFGYAQFLSGFDYSIEYTKGKNNSSADFLSRFPTEKPENEDFMDDYSTYYVQQMECLPVTTKEIREETIKDPVLSKLLHALETGSNLKELGVTNEAYSLENDCIFRGPRVVIPGSLQKRILDDLHTAHQGMTKMKALARSYCYWKGIDRDIEEMVRECRRCALTQNNPPKASHHWEDAKSPWQRIHVDYAGPMNGIYFLIVVDAYSRWVEVFKTNSTTSKVTIKLMRSLFARFGNPVYMISDNGPQFTSSDFRLFLKQYGVTHKTTAPYHPSSNGHAERYVQTIKQMLNSMRSEKGDLDGKLDCLLAQYRRTPHTTTLTSPYELMFTRKMRTSLTLLTDRKTTTKNETNGNEERSFRKGNRVQVRQYGPRQNKWEFGTIKERTGLLHYVITLDNGLECKRHVDQIRRTGVPAR